MGDSQRPVVIDAEKSQIKMTPVRLLLLIGVVVTIANFASNKLSAMATHADVDAKITTHGEHPHEPTTRRLVSLEKHDASQDAKDAVQDASLRKLEPMPEQVGAINAKLNLIISERVQENPAHMKRQARKIRAQAARTGKDDPLAGVDGL